VAEIDGRAVGFMLLVFTKVWGHKGETFEEEAVGIDWLDVHRDFQRKGISGQMLRKREKRPNHLFMHVAVKNLAMINFASKNGFKFAKYSEEFWGKGTDDAFLLIKES